MGSVTRHHFLGLILVLLGDLSKFFFKFLVLKRQHKFVYIVVDIIRPIIFVGLFFRHDHHFRLVDVFVSHFDWEAEI